MRKIYKYALHMGPQRIETPKDCRPLTFQMQSDMPCVWCEVDPDPEAPQVWRFVTIIGTGHEFNPGESLAYVGTAQDGPYVWHCYMEKT